MRGKKTNFVLLTISLVTLSISNVSADNEYMVEKGDSLSKIGLLLGVPWPEIMKANNLQSTVIHPKQILIIPSAGRAYSHETPIKSQELVNNPPTSFTAEPQVEVILAPAPVPVEVKPAAPSTSIAHSPVPQRTDQSTNSYSDALYIPPIQGNTRSRSSDLPEPPATYMVKNGDTIWSISRQFGLTLRELQKANEMAASKIYPGQVLSIPKKVVVAAN